MLGAIRSTGIELSAGKIWAEIVKRRAFARSYVENIGRKFSKKGGKPTVLLILHRHLQKRR
ncbi:hypothetical protein PsAD2_00484 [Pseudovibrio axinellae]|uniref:Uncharacterized protein n=1 Tax=Pseudovibrio axinellae TaxID=989403 RepID=A0A166AJI5_9HYPH|nr:hypothetical protein PsAD2_00484 [Pseudovibrio axinellae]SEQ91584.1 hypothetical protein SAMN05421798_105107 [Pseudovibrio axinellae]